MICCVCGKEITKSYGASGCCGKYCLECAIENTYVDEQYFSNLEKEFEKVAILEKALELACKNIEQIVAKQVDCKGGCPLYDCDMYDKRVCYQKITDYFTTKAQEILGFAKVGKTKGEEYK